MKMTVKQYRDFFAQFSEHFYDNTLYTIEEISAACALIEGVKLK